MTRPSPLSARSLNPWLWFKIGLMAFGGPAAHVSLIQSEVCERRKLADRDAYLRGLNFAMLLPGPEAQQLATYLGWHTGGIPGALVAGAGFVLPGAALMIAATLWVAARGDAPAIEAAFDGIRPVVAAFVTTALFKLARSGLKGSPSLALAAFALVTMTLFSGAFPLIILISGTMGALLLSDGHDHPEPDAPDRREHAHRRRTAFLVLATGIGLWLCLTVLCVLALPFDPYLGLDVVVSTAALSTFGGAYPAVAFVGEQAVSSWGWLSRSEMIDGLALAEALPGPLIAYNAYVGTMSALGHGVWGAVLGGALAVCFTFLPSFAMVIAFAPYVDRLYSISLVRAALAGVSAAVLGVIGKFALVLIHAACIPDGSPEWGNVALTLLAGMLIMTGRVPTPALIATGAAFGLVFPG